MELSFRSPTRASIARRAIGATLSALALATTAGCGAGDTHGTNGDGPIAAQMNDVSILFPLPAKANEIDELLAASAHGDKGELLPEALYDAVGHITGSTFQGPPTPGGVGEARYQDLRVVAARIDPCFASLHPDPHGAHCTAQLRLVLQEVKDDGGGDVGAFDSALHLFFELDRDELVELATDLVALREKNTEKGERLGALAPHPVMVKQGLGGAMAAGVRELVLAHAGADNLTRVAEFSVEGISFVWTFRAFDITDAAHLAFTKAKIPTLPGHTTLQSFSDGFGQKLDGDFNPKTMSKDDMTAMANTGEAEKLSTAARTDVFESLVRIENPGDASPNTIDCASCHLATPAARLVAGPLFKLSETTADGAFVPDREFVQKGEMKATFDAAMTPTDFHAFSYFERVPGISQRTVNETAAIVAYLNTLTD